MAQMQVLRLLDPRQIAKEHASIVAAIEARDPIQAVSMLETHLNNASSRIISVLEKKAGRRSAASAQ